MTARSLRSECRDASGWALLTARERTTLAIVAAWAQHDTASARHDCRHDGALHRLSDRQGQLVEIVEQRPQLVTNLYELRA